MIRYATSSDAYYQSPASFSKIRLVLVTDCLRVNSRFASTDKSIGLAIFNICARVTPAPVNWVYLNFPTHATPVCVALGPTIEQSALHDQTKPSFE